MNWGVFSFVMVLAVLTSLSAFGIYELECAHSDLETSCNACLDRNLIPCTFGNCTEYAETVADCCPQCWVEHEESVDL
jgi:hypothetical protein